MNVRPLDLLATGVESYLPYLQGSGELHDPVFDEPTQYGTAYHMFCHAALSVVGPPERREFHLGHAVRGLDAALTHTGNPSLTPSAAGFSRATGAVRRSNHRDFTWPPILKTYRILAAAGADRTAEFAERIRAVDIEASFRSRPPSNWASVWLSGEWIRIREDLSPYTISDVDTWLGVFLDDLLRPEDGFYFEPGKPNSYDLFTRYHVADLLAEGYDGRFRGDLERLMVTGLDRSLAVQMSDGSLASAHRSAGQTWTVGAQIAFFTLAERYFSGLGPDVGGQPANASSTSDPALTSNTARTAAAADGARRAFASMRRWQRADGPFSPVENLLPAGYRIGYEGYTADAHYGNLALAFLAAALLHGFTEAAPVTADRPPAVRVEHTPTYRGVAHSGPYSVAVNADPAPAYDGYGITDLTVGPGRFLQFASSVKHPESGTFVNLGMARRPTPGRTGLDIMAQRTFTLDEPLASLAPGPTTRGVRLRATAPEAEDQPAFAYELTVLAAPGGVSVVEATPGTIDHRTLLVPYLRDPGTGVHTTVEQCADGIHLTYGDETVAVTVDAQIEAMIHLPFGFENRRGLCGLLRLDLDEPADRISYRISVVG
ncbi:hypothetical protein ABN034_19585 [Actinopolymorpha sp. B11F2]|uniref:hypothetical protein n=1 Tax=Actinopolymorpha sp. B11F2 TaxID=3160862 RepID=UPI0032E51E54